MPRAEYGSRMEPRNNGRILAAELVGTARADARRPGRRDPAADTRATPDGDASTAAGLLKISIIALGFGFSLLIMAYVIGPISGCHINPAVTLGMLLARKVDDGARGVRRGSARSSARIGGAAIIYGIASGRDGFKRGQFAANLWTGQVLRARLDDRRRGRAHRPARDGRAVHHRRRSSRPAWAASSPASR